jgi:hypothetical protein
MEGFRGSTPGFSDDLNSGGWSPFGSTRHCGHQLTIVPASRDYGDGEFGGMMIGRETEVLGENMPQCHFIHHKSDMT